MVLVRTERKAFLEMNESPHEGRSPEATYDVVVIGAGQAGLAMGYFLKQQGRNFVILEAADSIGSAWRDRWESLRLFTPRGYSGLPGLPFPGDPDGYADRDEVIAYLERYADRRAADRAEQRGAEAHSRERAVRAGSRRQEDHRRARCCRHRPIPETVYPGNGEPTRAGRLPGAQHGLPQPVGRAREARLVVGGGNTGFQVAEELSSTRRVVLAIGSRQTPLHQRLLGRDLSGG